MKKVTKRTLSIVLSLCIVFGLGSAATAGTVTDVKGQYTYNISSPYDNVDWDNDKQYKASLHSHTNASDGSPSIADSIKEHYKLGYQILAITDHAVNGVEWDKVPQMVPLYRLFKFENTRMKDPVVLTSEERTQIINGTYECEERDESLGGMMEITGGCEANGATPINDCHVNTFWCEDAQAKMGLYGDYETIVDTCDKEGGISFLDHTGEYIGCEDDVERGKNPYYANKFANIFLKYDSCVAYDINSGKNNRTRYDVVVWDEILKLTIPNGRNVPCITFTDGHHIDEYDRAFTMMIMPEKTPEAFRTCMETGAWFSIGRFARMDLGEDFVGVGAVPEVHRVTVDEDTNTISFEGDNFNYVKWISGGKVIAEGENLTSIDLNEYEDVLDCYVRFQITGPGGILYSQAFVTMADGVEYSATVYKTFDFSMIMRAIVNILEVTIGETLIVKALRRLLWNRIW